ncbi:hypothetical protein SAMN05444349_11265 [Bacteroides faecichinchillae]|uniref:Uncharacterized protein n=1 Tax=Bacteroides faecichinchillae TaxID=871325 RepID=A0A1M4ZCQ9_9BACE|nr:hypothetical protein SAMN05444349_11265 [Bacteroides faecichinchillae]
MFVYSAFYKFHSIFFAKHLFFDNQHIAKMTYYTQKCGIALKM